MRRTILAAVAIAALLGTVGVAEAKVKLAPASCPAKADASFRITGAKGETDGVGSEYVWLAANRPGWKRDAQALIEGPRHKLYDLLYISKGRKKQIICFEITSFFGKGL